ncbi:uncharacterized protein LOC132953750 [Metopolophium dirhodum]|uniref:uncharacterized protein LOC132953750 n=1 Tax=Metopolophium dirhodum TaxID=44670 RepID=UPI00298FD4E3|nr:uncharacterized protein LOC132953750 [Metopolophium dirhodum]
MGQKKKWKNLRDTYAKELKKIPMPRSGADADHEPEYTGNWPYFESLSFLKVILKPRKQDENIIEPEESAENYLMDSSESTTYASQGDIFDTNMTQNNFEPQGSELERSESVMITENETKARRNYSISSASSSTTATTKQKRKHKDDGLEVFIQLEREKIEVLRQDQQDNNDDDLLWFKSMLPYVKQLPSLNKLRFRTQMQE